MKRLRSILRRSDPEWGELWGGVLMAVFGSWLLGPWETWVAYAKDGCIAGAYEFAALFWRDENWQGATFVAVGAAHVAAAVQQWRPGPRIFVAALGAIIWGIVVVSFVFWQWRSTASPIYGMCVLGQVGLLHRHWVEMRVQSALRCSAAPEGGSDA